MDEQSVTNLHEVRTWARSGRARRIRTAALLSQADIANAVGVDASTVARWEKGERLPRGAAAARYRSLLVLLDREDVPA